MAASEPVDLPEQLNIAQRFLVGQLATYGDKPAILCGARSLSYAEVDTLANRFGNLFRERGVEPEQRVLVALPDVPEFAAALFGTLKLGAAVVMVNKDLARDEVEYFYNYTRAKLVVVAAEQLGTFLAAANAASLLKTIVVVGEASQEQLADPRVVSFDARISELSGELECFPTHRDDPAIWLFSGGTTGRPKAVVQTHRSFANTTELYGKRVLGMTASDITLSVPKLYFGYATGSNLLFPFSVGGTCILFPERCTAEKLFELIAEHRPTVLINVPTMISKLLGSEQASAADLSCLRLSTSAGEALPVELYQRWKERFGVELLDGLGTAEMWHVFLTNRLGDVKPGTLGRVVAGFEVKVCDDAGQELPRGETGWLWVRGDSRALCYHQQHEKSQQAFRGEWYVSGDMISMDEDGYVTYGGRGDDMLKVGGKWLSPAQVENCLLEHPAVKECAVVGVGDAQGLVKPHAFVIARERAPELASVLIDFVRKQLEPYKAPRVVHVVEDLPRTHLGKIDRGKLRRMA
ncbi:MAG: benzoate-CoA ligase family protein [Myxococcales bacterium]|nr:benzoate-CoA ligase family protein [Myxococcales bacterium]